MWNRATADWIRDVLDHQDCRACIPPNINRTDAISYSKRTYKKRNLIERFFNKLKQFRHICTRFDRSALNYLAMAKLASIRLWLIFFMYSGAAPAGPARRRRGPPRSPRPLG
ncbi:MAG: transposase [Reyranella sp.]|nr:transposase [Reyranella sp.]